MTDAAAMTAVPKSIPELDFRYMDARFELVIQKVDHINTTIKDGFAKVDKILEDHEQRLRAQNETDARQAGELAQLRVQMADLTGNVKLLQQSISTMQSQQVKRGDEDNQLWKELLYDSLKAFIFGSGAFSALYFLMRANIF